MAKIAVISKAELEQMHTGSLMSRRNALLKCEESFAMSDQYVPSTNTKIEFKNTDSWAQAYADVKDVLSKREHLPNKLERKALRQQKAKKSR